MPTDPNGPPKEAGPSANERQGRPPTNSTSSHHTADNDILNQLRRRRAKAQRLVGGDPRWYEPPTAGYEDAVHHLLEQGLTPAPNREGLRLMWKRGGHHRRLAEMIAERWGMVA